MGLFDFLKPKKEDKMKDMMDQMSASFFPKGDKDINAVTDAVLFILNNKISREEAKNIAIKSVVISRISKEFTTERLKGHLAGYCLQHFNDKQVETFHDYLTLLLLGSVLHGKTPSEAVHDGNTWVIPK